LVLDASQAAAKAEADGDRAKRHAEEALRISQAKGFAAMAKLDQVQPLSTK